MTPADHNRRAGDRAAALALSQQADRANLERHVPKFGEWLPIETAPKDGTPIDAWLGNNADPYRVTDVRWTEPRLGSRAECWCHKAHDGCFGWIDEATGEPTHWMPLPTAPGAAS